MTRDSIVVTGASGFVGRRLLPLLGQAGHRIVAALRNPDRAPPGVNEVLRWELEQGRLPHALLERTRAVLHLAAHLPSSYVDADQARACLLQNAVGSLELARSVVEAGVPALVQVSTGNLYRDRGVAAAEDAAAFPSRQAPYYLASKLCAEIFSDHLAQQSKLRLVVLRPSAIYGPGMAGGMVHTFATRLLQRQSVVVQDGGRHTSDLVYVDDVARAIVASLAEHASGFFNLGSGHAATAAEVAECLRELIGGGAEVQIEAALPGPPGGFAALDIRRAREHLAYSPTPLAAGLAAYLEWLRK